MATVHSLRILMRVPIRVKNDAGIGGGEINAQTTGTSTQQEDEVAIIGIVARSTLSARLLGVEDVHLPLPIIDLGTTVDAAVLPLAEEEVVLNDVEEGRHLTEDEDLVLVIEQAFQHAIEEGKLATGPNEELRMGRAKVDAGGRVDRLTEQEGMVGILPLVHLLVGLAETASLLDALIEQDVAKDALLDEVHVPVLELGHASVDHNLLLGGHVGQDVALDTTKEEGTEDLVQLGNGVVLALLEDDLILLGTALVLLTNVTEAEPGLEDREIVEDGRVDEVEEGPQLVKIVLDRGSRQQKAVGRVDLLEGGDEGASMILEALSLIDDEVGESLCPSDLIELGLIADGNLVGCNDDGEVRVLPLLVMKAAGEHCLPVRAGPVIPRHGEGGEPLLKLPHPVGQGGQGGHDEEWSRYTFGKEGGNGGNHLDGLAEAHLVTQDAGHSVLVQRQQPPYALELVVLELASLGQDIGLDEDGPAPIGFLGGGVLVLGRLEGRRGGLAVVLLGFLLALGPALGLALLGLLVAPGELPGGLRGHVVLQFLEIGGDEVGVLRRLGQEEVQLVLPGMDVRFGPTLGLGVGLLVVLLLLLGRGRRGGRRLLLHLGGLLLLLLLLQLLLALSDSRLLALLDLKGDPFLCFDTSLLSSDLQSIEGCRVHHLVDKTKRDERLAPRLDGRLARGRYDGLALDLHHFDITSFQAFDLGSWRTEQNIGVGIHSLLLVAVVVINGQQTLSGRQLLAALLGTVLDSGDGATVPPGLVESDRNSHPHLGDHGPAQDMAGPVERDGYGVDHVVRERCRGGVHVVGVGVVVLRILLDAGAPHDAEDRALVLVVVIVEGKQRGGKVVQCIAIAIILDLFTTCLFLLHLGRGLGLKFGFGVGGSIDSISRSRYRGTGSRSRNSRIVR
mmetsp:Transcript_29792/g.86850  ORF Transcript_29792/g.86850 Transcript_29792/m.86850 type:complete len:901 (-) Transcript_29792:738-3440(-)